MDFFCFSTFSFFFHFIAYGLRPSGLGFDGFFLFFNLQLPFSFYCQWFNDVGFRLYWIFFSFFNLQLLFPFYCLWFKAVAFRLWWIFFVFNLQLLFPFYCLYGLRLSGLRFDGFFWFFHLQLLFPFYWLWFKAFGFRLWWIFFVFRLSVSFSILLPMV